MKERAVINTIKQQTEILRNSNDPMVAGIRCRLEEKGLDVSNLIVAEWYPDDASFEFGIVVTSSGDIYQFGYEYLDKPEGSGTFSEWENLTNTWKDGYHSSSIAISLKQYAENT